jgi:hypothetical protein
LVTVLALASDNPDYNFGAKRPAGPRKPIFAIGEGCWSPRERPT